jgi:hypothetical protein
MFLISLGARLSSPQVECDTNTTDTAMGILFMYETGRPTDAITIDINNMVYFGAPYFAVSFLLNSVLTTMIVVRLVLHRRNIRNVMGATAGAGELYKATITILVESSALFVVNYLLFIGTWATKSFIQYIFLQMLAQTQVRTSIFLTYHNFG